MFTNFGFGNPSAFTQTPWNNGFNGFPTQNNFGFPAQNGYHGFNGGWNSTPTTPFNGFNGGWNTTPTTAFNGFNPWFNGATPWTNNQGGTPTNTPWAYTPWFNPWVNMAPVFNPFTTPATGFGPSFNNGFNPAFNNGFVPVNGMFPTNFFPFAAQNTPWTTNGYNNTVTPVTIDGTERTGPRGVNFTRAAA